MERYLPILCPVVIGLIFFVIFTIKCHKQRSVGGVFLKNAVSIFFIVTAAVALWKNPWNIRYGLPILVGLVFGMLGDIYLDQKWVYPDDMRKYLYAGFTSFGIGHLFYIPAIYYAADIPLKYCWIPLLFGAVVCGFTLATEKATKQHFGEFRPTVAVYGVIVAGMAGTSMLAAVYTHGNPAFVCCAVGGVMFLISDLILSPMYFGPKEKNNSVNFFINHLTYYIAQYLLAISIALLTCSVSCS